MVSEINRRLMAKTSKFPLLPATKVVSIITISEMTSLNHESSTFYTFFYYWRTELHYYFRTQLPTPAPNTYESKIPKVSINLLICA